MGLSLHQGTVSFRGHLTLAVVLCAVLSLAGCGLYPTKMAPHRSREARIVPLLHVYVAPRDLGACVGSRVLVLPPRAYGPQRSIEIPVGRLLQEVLLQHRLFSVVELGETGEEMDGLMREAAKRGFDFVADTTLEPVLEPSGNSPGRVGARLRLISTANTLTIWDIAGGADLFPHTTTFLWLYESHYEPAPGAVQGLDAIFRAMARTMGAKEAVRLQR